LVVVSLLIGAAVLVNHSRRPRAGRGKAASDGPEEQAYAPQIHFLEPKMSRAANFLNQEVTLSSDR